MEWRITLARTIGPADGFGRAHYSDRGDCMMRQKDVMGKGMSLVESLPELI